MTSRLRLPSAFSTYARREAITILPRQQLLAEVPGSWYVPRLLQEVWSDGAGEPCAKQIGKLTDGLPSCERRHFFQPLLTLCKAGEKLLQTLHIAGERRIMSICRGCMCTLSAVSTINDRTPYAIGPSQESEKQLETRPFYYASLNCLPLLPIPQFSCTSATQRRVLSAA
jgi:hypothetical protein